ncbi:MAG TPA: hypothetical protein VGX68_06190 [Thermoanaerobaculia bacterium]|jgi:hypothetical protein|nr:hypothetical protein [Thermoanaerobaculia bacterium]
MSPDNDALTRVSVALTTVTVLLSMDNDPLTRDIDAMATVNVPKPGDIVALTAEMTRCPWTLIH